MCQCRARRRTVRRRESWRKDIEVRVKSKAWLRSVIANRELTVPQVAAKAGLSYQAVNFLVSERPSGRHTCSLDTAVRIAEALAWDMYDIFVPQVSAVRKAQPNEASKAAA